MKGNIVACAAILALGIIVCGAQQYEYNELLGRMESLKVEKAQAEEYENALREQLAETQALASRLNKRLELLKGVQPGIHRAHLRRVIQATLAHLGVKNTDAWERLLMLTVATESDMGRLLRQIRGPARGIFQVEKETEQYILRFFKIFDEPMYNKIRALRFPARLKIDELEANLAYSCAISWGI